eukprot:m.147250 g.147250  ORF g.147250 m.147250 type:complete len:175 (-) comp16256_c0_seq3:194-718(-)
MLWDRRSLKHSRLCGNVEHLTPPFAATLERAWYELKHSLDANLSAHDLLVTGGCTAATRAAAFSAFRDDPSAYVLLLATQANSAGLTLTSANNLIVLDVTLNLEDELQLLHRIHRIGQIRPVNIFRLAMENTVEENILRRRVSTGFQTSKVENNRVGYTKDELVALCCDESETT